MQALCEIAITPGKVEVNGNAEFQSANKSGPEYFKELYTFLDLNYPKFYKMDAVSKLYFLGVELVLKNSIWMSQNGKHTALIAGTTDGCLESDIKHIVSISGNGNALPSPAVFVYTLPNVMLGEVCIRHGITGENTCLIMQNINSTFLNQYTKIILSKKETAFCITGYVNYQPESYQCFLTLFAKE